MGVRTCLVLFAVACLVIGGCTVPSTTTNVESGQTTRRSTRVPGS